MKAGIDCYMSEETAKALDIYGERRVNVIEDKRRIKIGDTFQVFPFELPHDCEGAYGFIIHCDKEDMLFVPDCFHIKQRFGNKFSIIAIEVSYDNEILHKRVDEEKINETLAKRLLTSHMEKNTAMNYIDKFCDISRCHEIHLLHMSNDNIDKLKTLQEFANKFFIKTIICKWKG